MIRTYGLTHIALKVKDVKRSSLFYQRVFGAREMYVNDNFIQVQTPGSHDIIVFEQSNETAGNTGGIVHFGFRLQAPGGIEEAIKLVEQAGGIIKEQGEFIPGEPYLFFYDPDGYEIELWYERLGEELKDFN